MKRAATLIAAILALSCNRAEPRKATIASAPRVIFVGLDGADWRLLDEYIGEGVMPNLGALVRGGEKRTLITQHPPLSPLVWTTMMTGVSPLEHRILDFTRFNPATHEREPITSDERAVPAIWNMATSRGKKVGVFGMWATDPREPGVIQSDRDIRRQSAPTRGALFEKTQQETELTHKLASEWIAKNEPDLAIVYFEGTDVVGHLFAPNTNDPVRAYFARIDQIVGDYRDLATKLGATLVIASDHGFDWRTPRAQESGTAIATAAKWHRDEGVFLRWSPHRRILPRIGTASIRVDAICALLLDLLKLPRDVREYRRGWQRVAPQSSPASNEEIAKLTALGYIGAGEPTRGTSNDTRTPGSYNNEGLILRAVHRDDEAIAAFEHALRVDPKSASAMWNLSDLLHHAKRDLKRADALLDEAIKLNSNEPRWQLARGRYALERNDCKSARDDFRRAAQLSPNDPLAFAALGTAESCLGNEVAASDAFRRSLALDPNQPELRRKP
jgi:tetratricopeptide (TPR) repeat protein